MHWDIFCKVVDNYGDAGVCWRLARQLTQEHQQSVRLIIDELSTLSALLASSLAYGHFIDRVQLISWNDAHQSASVDCVIEAFACDLPLLYVHKMRQYAKQPIWINLEYLSAESWIEGCHKLHSKHSSGLDKVFFFPGFTHQTGGLLREQALLRQREIAQQQASAQAIQQLFPDLERCEAELTLSLFAYPHAPLVDLLTQLSHAKQTVRCLVPRCRIVPQIEQVLGQGALQPYRTYGKGALTVQILPFMSQALYDQLLWHCDLNFVRGEDSWVRAQWAARPLIWQAYPQADAAHYDKLAAFMQRYGANAGEWWTSVQYFGQAWNETTVSTTTLNTGELLAVLPQWRHHAQRWSHQLAQQTDLATQLVQYAQQTISH